MARALIFLISRLQLAADRRFRRKPHFFAQIIDRAHIIQQLIS
jgi:hypothetical protein